jgi:hypothetical protein
LLKSDSNIFIKTVLKNNTAKIIGTFIITKFFTELGIISFLNGHFGDSGLPANREVIEILHGLVEGALQIGVVE